MIEWHITVLSLFFSISIYLNKIYFFGKIENYQQREWRQKSLTFHQIQATTTVEIPMQNVVAKKRKSEKNNSCRIVWNCVPCVCIIIIYMYVFHFVLEFHTIFINIFLFIYLSFFWQSSSRMLSFVFSKLQTAFFFCVQNISRFLYFFGPCYYVVSFSMAIFII